MKCYRVYVNGEIAGTFFSLVQVAMKMDEFINAGFSDVSFEKEDY